MVEETVTMDRWVAYEAEWRDSPHVDDMVAHYLGYHKAKEAAETPMTQEEYFKRFPRKK